MKNDKAVLRMLSFSTCLLEINRRGTQLKRFRGTGIPYTRISEPTPKREHLTYHLVCLKKLPVF